ncbi:MAG TPA: dATP pyrophosphohydrolase [Caulobacteraceae bacterium]
MAAIEIVPVTTEAEKGRFVRVPMRIAAKDPQWIPPLIMERMEALTPKTNPLFEHTDVQLWIARRDGKDVGRISAQIDHLAPSDPANPSGYFGMIHADDDAQVFQALFAVAEDWLKQRGVKQALGPFNLSINEETGLLVDGFDTPPMVMMGHDQPYVAGRIEALGYAKIKDVYAYKTRTSTDLPAGIRRRVGRSLPQGVTLRQLNFKSYEPEVRAMTEIMNEAWSDNWGHTEITEAETRQLAKSMRPIINEKLVWFADIDGESAGFGVCLPNVNEAIRDLGGKLLPFGFAKLLWRLKVSGVKTARVPLMGVKRKFARDFRGQLLPFLLIDKMRAEALKAGIEEVEMSWILEDNKPMRAIIETAGSDLYKTYRIYQKALV